MPSKCDIQFSHYQDKAAEKDRVVKERNRFFVAVLVIAALLGAFVYDAEAGAQMAVAFLSQHGVNATINADLLRTALWLGLLYAFMRYVQASKETERLYLYMRRIESDLSASGCFISFEGENYDKSWSLLPKLIGWLYNYFFIAAFAAVAVIKIVCELTCFTPIVVIDCICCTALIVLALLYWRFLHWVDKQYDEESK